MPVAKVARVVFVVARTVIVCHFYPEKMIRLTIGSFSVSVLLSAPTMHRYLLRLIHIVVGLSLRLLDGQLKRHYMRMHIQRMSYARVIISKIILASFFEALTSASWSLLLQRVGDGLQEIWRIQTCFF